MTHSFSVNSLNHSQKLIKVDCELGVVAHAFSPGIGSVS